MATKQSSKTEKTLPIVGGDSIMTEKSHGTAHRPAQKLLRWGCDREIADRICCYNRHGAEPSQYYTTRSEFMKLKEAGEAITFYDSVSGLPLYKAPQGRTWDEFLAESNHHGWPSFRDPEVIWENIRCLENGESVSVTGTHLGHNLPSPDGRNRYCINLCCIAGNASTQTEEEQKTMVLARAPPPIVYKYWPFMGRGAGIRYLLEDSGAAFVRKEQTAATPGAMAPSVFAVPAAKINGSWISQTCAILLALSETLGYEPQPAHKIVSIQTVLNIMDAWGELLKKARAPEADRKDFFDGRMTAWLAAIESAVIRTGTTASTVKMLSASFFYGDAPTFVDFEFLKLVHCLRFVYGDKAANAKLASVAPNAAACATNTAARPALQAFLSSGCGGMALFNFPSPAPKPQPLPDLAALCRPEYGPLIDLLMAKKVKKWKNVKGLMLRPPLGLKPESVDTDVANEFVKEFLPKVWRVLQSEGVEKKRMVSFRKKLSKVKK